jgi:hypothetical protein
MVNVPAGWQGLMTDDSARARRDPFAESEGELAPLPSVSELIPITLLPGEKGVIASAPRELAGSGTKPGKRGARADYDIEDMTSERGAMRAAPAAVVDADIAPSKTSASKRKSKKSDLEENTFQGQKVWTNSHTIVRGKRRSKAPFVIILSLLLLSALELSGLAVMRPDICVTHACSVVAAKVRQYAPISSIPGITAAVAINPSIPEVTAVVGSTSQAQFTLINTSADPINWSATASLNWVTITPARGELAGQGKAQLTAIAKPFGVASGVYSGGITVTANYGQVIEPIVVTVKPAGRLVTAQQSLAVTQCGSPVSITLQNTGSQSLTFSAMPSQQNALEVSPGSGSLKPGASTALAVTVSCGATHGTYAVIIVSNGGSQTVIIAYQ